MYYLCELHFSIENRCHTSLSKGYGVNQWKSVKHESTKSCWQNDALEIYPYKNKVSSDCKITCAMCIANNPTQHFKGDETLREIFTTKVMSMADATNQIDNYEKRNDITTALGSPVYFRKCCSKCFFQTNKINKTFNIKPFATRHVLFLYIYISHS